MVRIAFSPRSATARYFLLFESANAVIPSLSTLQGRNRWVLVSVLYSTMLCPAVER